MSEFFDGYLPDPIGVGLGGVPAGGTLPTPELYATQDEDIQWCVVGAELPQLVGVVTGLVGTLGQTTGILQQLAGFSTGLAGETGTVAGTLPRPTPYVSESSEAAPGRAEVNGVLFSTIITDITSNANSCFGILQLVPGSELGDHFCSYGQGANRGHMYDLLAIGYTGVANTMVATHGGAYTFTGTGSAKAEFSYVGAYTLSASGTLAILGTLQRILPRLTGLASGTFTEEGRVATRLPKLQVTSAVGGAQARTTGPRFTVVASGTVAGLGRLTKTLPKLTLVASGTVSILGRLDAVLPTLQAIPSGRLSANLPRLSLWAHGHAPVAVTYEGYSVVLMPTDQGEVPAVTRYTNYPFNRIVRFGNKYYGVGDDGLFELEGSKFDTAPIVSVVTTGETDAGTSQLKRPVSLYIGGRMGVDMDVSVTASESPTYTYTYQADVYWVAGNQRALFGKGIRARYLSYTFTNTAGTDFELDELRPEIDVLRRTA